MIQGSDSMRRKLADYSEKLAALIPEALERAAAPMAEAARSMAPVDSGALRESIEAKVVVRSDKGAILELGPTGHQRRSLGHILEFGTSKMSARPFLRPALDETADQCLEIIASVLKGELEK